ncbi:MAG: hypothetical protein J0H67_00735 [Rhodospirillales bacterium]|nr:hypothetical protein [Rhodospirillales bacterium]
MRSTQAVVPPLLPTATRAQATAILGAMRAIAAAGRAPSAAAERSVRAAARHIFGDAALADATGATLRPAVGAGSPLATTAVQILAVMVLVDGTIEAARVAALRTQATALGVTAPYLDLLDALVAGRRDEALAEMTRVNMDSVTNAPWPGGDINAWLLPYRGDGADPALAARFAALGALPPETIGHALWAHFRDNGYAFPGEPDGLNAAFSLPHDTVHVLTGYDTKPAGEILTSTFTAAMHPIHPIEGHVLPAIVSWHVGARINEVAKDATGALDVEEVWRAWAAGAAARIDTFAPGWSFWSIAAEPLAGLRTRSGLPAEGLAEAGQ